MPRANTVSARISCPSCWPRRARRLDELRGFDSGGDEAQREQTAQAQYLDLAGKLSAARKKAAQELGGKVSAAMQSLAMAGGRFEIALTAFEGNAHGLEEIEFMVSAHASLPPKPLAKVASGGELSRISLAIQVITSKVSLVPTLIFDEVDVGIGGGVAEVVGQLLKQLGAERQVLCVTHLPQVAAQGDHHWQVSKNARDGGVVEQHPGAGAGCAHRGGRAHAGRRGYHRHHPQARGGDARGLNALQRRQPGEASRRTGW